MLHHSNINNLIFNTGFIENVHVVKGTPQIQGVFHKVLKKVKDTKIKVISFIINSKNELQIFWRDKNI